MKKGFTLIELLAVIVILAIIALIATPIVLNIINDTKESAVFRSADFYLDGVEKAVATSILNNKAEKDGTYFIMETGNICLENYDSNSKKYNDNDNDSNSNNNELVVQVKGEKPTSGSITIKGGEIEKTEFIISNKEIWKDPFTNKLEYKLAPGLYDKDNNLLASWEELNQIILEETQNQYDFKNLVETGGVDEESQKGYAAKVIEGLGATKLVIDSSVISVGEGAFYGCSVLTSVTIPSSVTSIGYGAFGGCTGLKSITIPNSVTSIGYWAFSGCTNLTSITIGNGVTSIGEGTFYGCSGLTSITIPNSVTSIGNYAFYGCSGLTSITIPNSVTSIGYWAFSGCSGLKSITIPNSVTSIVSNAFWGCTSLTSITIPNSVTSIEEGAFEYCTSLTTIYYYKGTATSEDNWGAPNATVVTDF